jgi:hypothetical protein
LAEELLDLAATERQLGRLLRQSALEDATFQRLQEAVVQQRRCLLTSLPEPSRDYASSWTTTAKRAAASSVAVLFGVVLALAAQGWLPPTTWALLAPFLLVGITSDLLHRQGRFRTAYYLALAAWAVACVTFLRVALPPAGLQQPATAALICALTATAGLIFNRQRRSAFVASLCCALFVAATLWALWSAAPRSVSTWGIVLTLEALTLRALSARLGRGNKPHSYLASLCEPLARSADGIILVALLAACGSEWLAPAASLRQMLGNGFPFFLLTWALVARAVRRSSQGALFAAGLVVNAMVLAVQTLAACHGASMDIAMLLPQLLQSAMVTAELWLLGWLLVPTLGDPRRTSGSNWLRTQVSVAAWGNAVLIVGALIVFLLQPLNVPYAWPSEAGSTLGWLALTALASALLFAQQRGQLQIHPQNIGTLGFAGLVLIACTLYRSQPAWGFRFLLVGTAAYAFGWWSVLARSRSRRSETATFWTVAAGGLALLLALKAMAGGTEYLYAAAAVLMVSTIARCYGSRFEREYWVFAAGLGLNLALSVLFRCYQSVLGLEETWVELIQVNVLAAAAYALTMRRRTAFYVVQSLLGSVGIAFLLAVSAGYFLNPQQPIPSNILLVGSGLGWCAFLAALVPAADLGRQYGYHIRGPLLAVSGLGIGVLAACRTASAGGPNWQAYHLSLAVWIGTALSMLVARAVPLLYARAANDPWPTTRGWTFALCLLIQMLACCGTGSDPAGPFWTGTATLIVLAMLTLLALRTRQVVHIFSSGVAAGLLFHVIALARLSAGR